MTSEVVLGDADEDCRLAMVKMDRANIRHLPILSGGRVVSMLSGVLSAGLITIGAPPTGPNPPGANLGIFSLFAGMASPFFYFQF